MGGNVSSGHNPAGWEIDVDLRVGSGVGIPVTIEPADHLPTIGGVPAEQSAQSPGTGGDGEPLTRAPQP